MSGPRPILRDAIAQFERLVHGKILITQGTAGSPEEDGLGLTVADRSLAGKMLKAWITRFARSQDLPELCNRMVKIANSHKKPPRDANMTEKERKKLEASILPHKRTIDLQKADEKSDHSVTFWVLDTLYEVFASIANVDGFSLELAEFPGLFGSRANAYPFHPGAQEDRICREDLASVPTSVIDVCFGYIHHSNSVAEQEAASRCLGVLSQFFLGDISHRFVACMNRDVVTDVGQREYTTYQLAISNIAFDLTPGERLDTTMKYLQLLLKVMKTIERGVLRSAICTSLLHIFRRIMLGTDEASNPNNSSWARLKDQNRRQQFLAIYTKMYEQVAKWSRKEKHRLHAAELMANMVTLCRSYQFYSSKKREDVVPLLVQMLKKSEHRSKALTLLREYIRDVPMDFVSKDSQAFTDVCRRVLNGVVARDKNYGNKEVGPSIQIILELAQKHVHYVVHDFIIAAFQPEKIELYSTRQKSILLTALGSIAQDNPDEMKTYHYYFGPSVAKIIKSASSKPSLREDPTFSQTSTSSQSQTGLSSATAQECEEREFLTAALTCFPHIRCPEASDVLESASVVGRFVTSSDRGVRMQAIQALRSFASMDLANHMIPTIFLFVEILCTIPLSQDQNADMVLRAIVDILVDLQPLGLSQSGIEYSDWTALRQQMEAATLARLCSPNILTRAFVAKVLSRFCSPEFRAFEASDGVTPPLFLIDALYPEGGEGVSAVVDDAGKAVDVADDASPLPSYMLKIIERENPVFGGVTSRAWKIVHSWLPFIPLGGAVHTNIVTFLCVSTRLPKSGFSSVASLALRDRSPRPTASNPMYVEDKTTCSETAGVDNGQVLSQPLTLTYFGVAREEIELFFDKLLAILYIDTGNNLDHSPASEPEKRATAPGASAEGSSSSLESASYSLAMTLCNAIDSIHPSMHALLAKRLRIFAGIDQDEASNSERLDAVINMMENIAARGTPPEASIASLATLSSSTWQAGYERGSVSVWAASAVPMLLQQEAVLMHNKPANAKQLRRESKVLHHEHILRVLHSLLVKQAPETPSLDKGAHASPVWTHFLLPTLRHCVESWASIWAARTPHTFTSQSLRAKALVAKLIRLFILHTTLGERTTHGDPDDVEHDNPRSEWVAKYRALLFQILTDALLAKPEPEPKRIVADEEELHSRVENSLTRSFIAEIHNDLEPELSKSGRESDFDQEQGDLQSEFEINLPNLSGDAQDLVSSKKGSNVASNDKKAVMALTNPGTMLPPPPRTPKRRLSKFGSALGKLVSKSKRKNSTGSASSTPNGSREGTPSKRRRSPSKIAKQALVGAGLAVSRTFQKIASGTLSRRTSNADQLIVLIQKNRKEEEEMKQIQKDVNTLEDCILEAVCALLEVGPVESVEFHTLVTKFLHDMSFSPYAAQSVALGVCLQTYLSRNKTRLDKFLSWSFADFHKSPHSAVILEAFAVTEHKALAINRMVIQREAVVRFETPNASSGAPRLDSRSICEHAFKAALLFRKAVISSWTLNLQEWMVGYKLAPSKLAMYSIVSQTSSDEALRVLSLRLARLLANAVDGKMDPGYNILDVSLGSRSLYLQQAMNYSEGLAKALGASQLLEPFLEEGTRLLPHLSMKEREVLARLLVPWVERTGERLGAINNVKGLSEDEKYSEDYCTKILCHLRDLTNSLLSSDDEVPFAASLGSFAARANLERRFSHDAEPSSSAEIHSAGLWLALLQNEVESGTIVPVLVRFLVAACGAPETSTRMKLFIKALFLRMNRGGTVLTRSTLMVDTLMKLIRSYPDDAPADPSKFMEWQELATPSPRPSSPQEKIAFTVIMNMLVESRVDMSRHLPCLLQNMVVLYPTLPEAKAIKHYLLLHASASDAEARTKSMESSLSAGFSTSFVQLEKSESAVAGGEIHELVSTLKQSLADEDCQKWSREALVWALNSTDTVITQKSLILFKRLAGNNLFEEGSGTLVRLLGAFYHAIRTSQENVMRLIVEILTQPTDVAYDKLSWMAMISVGWALLCMSKKSIYNMGLFLMHHFLVHEQPVHVNQDEQHVWLNALGEPLAFFRRSTSQPLDDAIACETLRGFAGSDTAQKTLNVTLALSPFYAHKLQAENSILNLLLLENLYLRCSNIEEMGNTFAATNRKEELSKKKQQEMHESRHGRIVSCADLALLLHDYATSIDEAPAVQAAAKSLFEITRDLAISFCAFADLPAHQLLATYARPDGVVLASRMGETLRRTGRMAAFSYNNTPAISSSSSSSAAPFAANDNVEAPGLHFKFAGTLNGTLNGTLGKGESIKVTRMFRYADGTTGHTMARMAALLQADGDADPNAAHIQALRSGKKTLKAEGVWPLILSFMGPFVSLFSSRAQFDVTIDYFTKMLTYGSTQSKTTRLLQLGAFLQLSKHAPNAEQFTQLNSLLFKCHYAAIPRVGRIAADVAQILADNCGLLAEAPPKTGLSMTETFDFVRPRVRLPKTFGMGDVLMCKDEFAYNRQKEEELDGCLTRISAQTYPLLSHLMTTGSEETLAESVRAASEAYYAAHPNLKRRTSSSSVNRYQASRASAGRNSVEVSAVEEIDDENSQNRVYSYGATDAEDESNELSQHKANAPPGNKHAASSQSAAGPDACGTGNGTRTCTGSFSNRTSSVYSKGSPSFNNQDQTFADVANLTNMTEYAGTMSMQGVGMVGGTTARHAMLPDFGLSLIAPDEEEELPFSWKHKSLSKKTLGKPRGNPLSDNRPVTLNVAEVMEAELDASFAEAEVLQNNSGINVTEAVLAHVQSKEGEYDKENTEANSRHSVQVIPSLHIKMQCSPTHDLDTENAEGEGWKIKIPQGTGVFTLDRDFEFDEAAMTGPGAT